MKPRGATTHELPAIARLSARAFTREYADRVQRFAERHYGPRAKPELARLLEVDGEPVSSVRIQDHTVQMGRSRLRLAGIADVGTDPDHRQKGYASSVMRDTLRFATQNGFDVSLLFGRQDFYDRFGYIEAMGYSTLTVAAKDALKAPRRYRSRPYRPQDLPDLKRLFRLNGEDIWCNVVRQQADWEFRKERLDNARVLVGPHQRTVAYALFDFETGFVNVRELGAVPKREVLEGLLHHLGQLAKKKGAERLRFWLPLDHPAALVCADYGANLALNYVRNGGGMACILNLQNCLDRMLPQWSRQLSMAGFRSRVEFRLETDLGNCDFRCAAGRIERVEGRRLASRLQVPQTRLTQLLFGYQPPDVVLSRPDVKVSKDLLPLLRILFPERHAFLWPHDHF